MRRLGRTVSALGATLPLFAAASPATALASHASPTMSVEVMAQGQTAHQSSDPVEFTSTDTLTLVPGGEPVTVVVANRTTTKRRIATSVDVPEGPANVVLVDPARAVPAAGSVVLKVLAGPDEDGSSGFIVVADRSGERVIRRPFSVSAATASPAVTSRSQVAELWPMARSATVNLAPLPMEEGVCPIPAPSALLTNGTDDADLETNCAEGVLQLTASGFDGWSTGSYEGTLVVGATDVSVKLTKRAPVGMFLLVVLAGVLIALLLRSFVARKAITSTETAVTAIGPEPELPASWSASPKAREWLAGAVGHTRQGISAPLSTATLWGGRENFRWLLAPSTKAEQALEKAQTRAQAADDALGEWNDEASEVLASLEQVGAPPALANRAAALRNGTSPARAEPGDPAEPRQGIDGMSALLAEAKALHALHTVKLRLDALGARISPDPPPADYPWPQGVMLRRAWASARIEHSALEALLARTVDARTTLDDALLARVEQLTEDVDQLPLPPPAPASDLETSQADALAVTSLRRTVAGPWQLLPRVGQMLSTVGASIARRGEFIGETAVVLLAVAVVLVTAFTAGYSGEDWGSVTDVVVTFVGAAGGIIVLTPLVTALDRLAGRDDGSPS